MWSKSTRICLIRLVCVYLSYVEVNDFTYSNNLKLIWRHVIYFSYSSYYLLIDRNFLSSLFKYKGNLSHPKLIIFYSYTNLIDDILFFLWYIQWFMFYIIVATSLIKYKYEFNQLIKLNALTSFVIFHYNLIPSHLMSFLR